MEVRSFDKEAESKALFKDHYQNGTCLFRGKGSVIYCSGQPNL